MPIPNSYVYSPIPYVGSLAGINVNLCTTTAAVNGNLQTSGHQSKSVYTVFNWGTVYLNAQSANINMQSINPQPLDQIVMVYVDNTLNAYPITLYFPDTQFTVEVAAGDAGYYPVITGGMSCTVYNGAETSVTVGSSNITTIQFCNFCVAGLANNLNDNVVSNWLSSNQGTFATFPTYAPNALGDLYSDGVLDLTVNTPLAVTGFLQNTTTNIITGIELEVVSSYNILTIEQTITLYRQPGVIPLLAWSFMAMPNLKKYDGFILSRMTGLYIPIPISTANGILLKAFSTQSSGAIRAKFFYTGTSTR